jgi:hypothetical protein
MAKPSTYTAGATYQLSATATTASTSSVLKNYESAVLISVETTDARITFDGSTPSSTNGHVFPKGNPPVLVLVGGGSSISHLANSAGTSLVNITPLQ